MNNVYIAAASRVTPADIPRFQLGKRFGRLDPACQLGITAVEALGIDFSAEPRAEVAVCVSTSHGCTATDVDYWLSRHQPGGASPTLFVYTLPSSVIGEIAIRHSLTGPNLCLIGGNQIILAEARDLLQRGEAAACLVVYYEVLHETAAASLSLPPQAVAGAVYLQKHPGKGGILTENDRDLISLCAKISA